MPKRLGDTIPKDQSDTKPSILKQTYKDVLDNDERQVKCKQGSSDGCCTCQVCLDERWKAKKVEAATHTKKLEREAIARRQECLQIVHQAQETDPLSFAQLCKELNVKPV